MNEYQRMARIINYLDLHYEEQPSLENLAKIAGLSPYHFHRSFASWTGITPKAFIQCLTLEKAKESLEKGENVLNASLDAGLSSSGRLHDLCVTLESATPGEIKSGGEGLDIQYGFGLTPFGMCLIGQSSRGICHLSFVSSEEDDEARNEISTSWPQANLLRSDNTAQELVKQVFTKLDTNDKRQNLHLWVKGTRFQLQVWRALLRIPPGYLLSYGQIASDIGHPGSARAVGSAIGGNPTAYLIPCHRVLRATGAMGGYRWGIGRKRVMIAYESAELLGDKFSHGEH